MSDIILDFYANEQEFKSALVEAAREAVTDKEQDFVADLEEKLKKWGERMFLSEAQYNWLERIASGERHG